MRMASVLVNLTDFATKQMQSYNFETKQCKGYGFYIEKVNTMDRKKIIYTIFKSVNWLFGTVSFVRISNLLIT